MREILFRGKRIDNGKWVEGWYCPKKTGHYEGYRFVEEMQSIIIVSMTGGGYQYAVAEPRTICQYTGLTDKNGRKIFEGDIVKAILLPYNKDGYSVGYIVFERGTFKVYITKSVHKGEYTKYAGEDVKTYSIENNFLNRGYVLEVIGNIFDNPELLGVENEID